MRHYAQGYEPLSQPNLQTKLYVVVTVLPKSLVAKGEV